MQELNAETFIRSVEPIAASKRIGDKIKPFCQSVSVRRDSTFFLIADGEIILKQKENGISIFISAQTIIDLYGIGTILSYYIYLEIKLMDIHWRHSSKLLY
ncbi:hypothetical protein BLA27_02545 [Brucella cytisi]|uniref:Uncharacterized protein n=1 Tax=Brucella cytisi TaxID=407152 RepID=A0A1J6IIH1_9HYPH|nr:hypothetical protein BLA27_02545 [Brucella cytisi]